MAFLFFNFEIWIFDLAMAVLAWWGCVFASRLPWVIKQTFLRTTNVPGALARPPCARSAPCAWPCPWEKNKHHWFFFLFEPEGSITAVCASNNRSLPLSNHRSLRQTPQFAVNNLSLLARARKRGVIVTNCGYWPCFPIPPCGYWKMCGCGYWP